MSAILAMQIDSLEDDWLKKWDRTPPAVLKDAPIMVTRLPIGDARIWCADGILLSVERKTPSDFLSSIPNDHILDQVGRMRADYTQKHALPYLVITGEIRRDSATGKCIIAGSKHGEGWNYNAVQGVLLSIQECGVPVIYCDGDDEYAPTLLRLATRNHERSVVNPQRIIEPLTAQEQVLCAFPGIGPKTAGEILARATSLAWALSYLCDTSPTAPKIAGVGDATKLSVIKTLQLEDGNTLDVIAR